MLYRESLGLLKDNARADLELCCRCTARCEVRGKRGAQAARDADLGRGERSIYNWVLGSTHHTRIARQAAALFLGDERRPVVILRPDDRETDSVERRGAAPLTCSPRALDFDALRDLLLITYRHKQVAIASVDRAFKVAIYKRLQGQHDRSKGCKADVRIGDLHHPEVDAQRDHRKMNEVDRVTDLAQLFHGAA